MLNIFKDPDSVKNALIAMGDYGTDARFPNQGSGYSYEDAITAIIQARSTDQNISDIDFNDYGFTGIIYGSNGTSRYQIMPDGRIAFSSNHRQDQIQRALENGFVIE